jgi:hypothetical protein
MDRTELLSQITTASSLNQISSAMSAARAWLTEHPEDDQVRDGVQGLARLEREHLAYSRR